MEILKLHKRYSCAHKGLFCTEVIMISTYQKCDLLTQGLSIFVCGKLPKIFYSQCFPSLTLRVSVNIVFLVNKINQLAQGPDINLNETWTVMTYANSQSCLFCRGFTFATYRQFTFVEETSQRLTFHHKGLWWKDSIWQEITSISVLHIHVHWLIMDRTVLLV